MTEQRLQRVRALFDQALDLPPTQQKAFLDASCPDDPDLRSRVEYLLACDARLRAHEGKGGSFLDSPLVRPPQSTILPEPSSLPQTRLGQAGVVPPEGKAGAEATRLGRLGRYELLEEIGRGGMGCVLRGHDPDLGRDLAVKVLLAGQQHDPEMVSRFTEEAQIGGQLQHPGIVPVYEMGRSADQRPYFTMKLVRGRTLAALLHERVGPGQDLPHLLQVFEQVCQTMAYAHSHGVIHRDLKPSNVMVGAFGEVQVMDWGLAKVLPLTPLPPSPTQRRGGAGNGLLLSPLPWVGEGGRGCEGRRTQAGQVLGTPAYMAPEQASGEVDRLDQRCDVFGLGAILCEILTGQPPYSGVEQMQAVSRAVCADLAEAFARLDTCGADEELIGLARSSLAARVEDRPRDAGVLAAQMAAYRESMATRLRQAELAQAEARARVAEEGKRRRLTLGLAASVLLTTLVVGGAWLWIAHLRAERERQARDLQADLMREAEKALTRASSLRGQARSEGSAEKSAEARAQAQRAKTLLERLSDQTALGEQVSTLLRELDDEEADRRLVAQLEEVRLLKAEDHPREARFAQRRAVPRYAEVLRPFGVTDLTVLPERAAARIRERPTHVRTQVVAALDDWVPLISDPNSKQARRLEAVVNAADPDPWRQRLRAARRQQDYKALADLAREVRVDRQPPETLQLLAWVLWYHNSQPQALSLLRRAQVQYPADFWINYMLGWYLRHVPDQSADALRFLTVAAALRPHSPTALCQVGEVLVDTDVAGAIAVFRRATTLKPELPAAHYGLGVALAGQGDRDGAFAAWRRAVALRPHARLHSNIEIEKGRFHVGRREWQQAIACYARAQKLFPREDSLVWFEYAAVLLLSGDEAGYRKTCADLVQRCGKTPEPLRAYLVARACTLAPGAAADAARAGRLAQPMLKTDSTGAWSLTQQAALEHRAGRLAQALPLLEQSLKATNSKRGNAVLNWLWLALTYQGLGKNREAKSWLEMATRWLDRFREGMPARAEQELNLHLHNWLEAHVLRREAEALLGAPAAQRK
jgi:serine/threonine-protein kinase